MVRSGSDDRQDVRALHSDVRSKHSTLHHRSDEQQGKALADVLLKVRNPLSA